jgi:putative methyltransferase
MNLLICNPNFKKHEIYLPYLWGRIKEYCEFQDERDFTGVNFLDPIFEGGYTPEDYEGIIESHDFRNIDVLFLSCYVWNWELNLKIAKRAKNLNPDMVIIAGGPSALYKPWQDVSLFEICDYVTPGEGEKISADILFCLLNKKDLKSIDHLVDPRHPRDVKIPRQTLSNFRSPYVEYKEDYVRFAKKIKDQDPGAAIIVLWETNRGCPYRCSFCDWGSTTNSKIKRFDKKIIEQEIEVICKDLKPHLIFNVDANFGILPEDIEYAQWVANAKMKYGYPSHGMYFSAAKNHKHQVNKIMKILHDNYLLPFAQIPFQHTDPEVLESIDRDNINTENLADSMRESFEHGLPMSANIILGNPGDNPIKWRKALKDMLETRFHDMRVHDFRVLPNAPASDPSYVERYKIRTMKRKHMADEFGIMNEDNGSFNAYFVQETSTFDKNDYVNMQIDSVMVLGYHVLNLTKFLCFYLRYYHDVPYMDFYYELKKTPTIERHISDLKVSIKDWVEGRSLYKFTEFKGDKFSFDVYLKIRGVIELENIMADIFYLLTSKYNVPEELAKDLIEFQKRTIVGFNIQKDVEINHNLPEVMSAIMRMHPLQHQINVSLRKEKTVLKSNQKEVGSFNKMLRKVDISNIKDYNTWINSKIHSGVNLRTSVNYYNEVLES